MAGTNVGAVYLKLELDTRELSRGFLEIEGRSKTLGERFARVQDTLLRMFSRGAFEPIYDAIGGISESAVPAKEGITSLSDGFADFVQSAAESGQVFEGFGTTADGVASGLAAAWQAVLADMNSGWTDMLNGIERSFVASANRIQGGMNALAAGLRGLETSASNLGLGGSGLMPNVSAATPIAVPAMATGGIVSAPTLALIGERGREAVLPLENNTAWMADLANVLVEAMAANQVYAKGNAEARVELYLDGAKLAEGLLDDLQDAAQRRDLAVISY